MKKAVYLIIAGILIITLAACGNNTGGQSNDNPTGKEVAEDNGQSNYGKNDLGLIFDATIEETVLVDEKGIRITAKELSFSNSYAELSLFIENNSDMDLSFYAGTTGCPMNSINGYMIPDGYLSEDIAAGMTANETISFSLDQLALYGFKDIADIGVGFEVKTEDYDDYLLTGSINIKTSVAGSYDYSRDTFKDSMESKVIPAVYGFTVDYQSDTKLFEEAGLEILNEYLVTNKDGEKALFMEVINNSANNLYVDLSDIVINGVTVSGMGTSEYMVAGKRAVVSISLDDYLDKEYMEILGMKDYSNFEVYFGVMDEGYNPIAGKDISIRFNGEITPLDFEDSIVYEANGFKFMNLGTVKSGSSYSDDIHVLVLVKNGSGKSVTIDDGYGDVYVNKLKISSLCASQSAKSGGYALMDIQLMDYDLEANDLDMSNITEVSIKFEIRDTDYNKVDEPTVTLTY